MEIALILLIIILLIFNRDMFNKSHNSCQIKPYTSERFDAGPIYLEIDNHYQYDRNGLKSVMYNLNSKKKYIKSPEKSSHNDHFDCIVKKLELYDVNYYDKL